MQDFRIGLFLWKVVPGGKAPGKLGCCGLRASAPQAWKLVCGGKVPGKFGCCGLRVSAP